MIKITKPQQAPAILRSRGSKKRAAHCAAYLQHKTDYDAGRLPFNFDSGIYGDATVKQALIAAQHGKCCYCESKTGADGDIEHFRPKAACRQTPKAPLLRPGYYWLAYDWDNLLLSCSACNQRHKGNLFPLTDPDERACSHADDITQEMPLLLHPAQCDPEQFISFRKEIPFALNGNRVGKTTIEALGLNRPLLQGVRRDRLDFLIKMRNIVALEGQLDGSKEGRQVVAEAKKFLAFAVTDAGEFAAMARAAAKADFHFPLP